MTYKAALAWLAEARTRGVCPGLSRTEALLAVLGNPQDGLCIVHVAGTNGKGSTCAFVDGILREAGVKTGFFSSPWLEVPEEMFRLDGLPVSRTRFAAAVSAVAAASMQMLPKPGLPTEYEAYAAMAYWLFADHGCEVAVVETCMGGKLDTTNTYRGGNIAVLTGIAMDHAAFLGNTPAAIARHKARILRKDCTAIVAPQTPEVMAVLEEEARQTGATLQPLCPDDWQVKRVDETGTSFWLKHTGSCQTRMIGAHQALNAACAAAAVRVLSLGHPEFRIPDKAMIHGIRNTNWPCRFEVLHGVTRTGAPMVGDCAHNPSGMEVFAETFGDVFPGRRAHVIFGAMRDKDVSGMLEVLLPLTDTLHLVAADTARAMAVEELETFVGGACCVVMKHDTMEMALEAGLGETPPEDILVVVGSALVAGCIMAFARKQKSTGHSRHDGGLNDQA